MLGITMKNLQKILKQSSFIVYTTTPHIRTISSSSAVAVKNFHLLLPQDKQHHGGGIIMAACHAKLGAETIKRLQFSPHVTVPHVNITTTSKRGFCSVFVDHQTKEITMKGSYIGAIIGRGGEVIRRIEMDSGTSIDIAARDEFENTRDRLITITGSNEQIEHANKLIEEVKREPYTFDQKNYSQGQTTTITIADDMAGFLIGRGGERKRKIEEQSGARFNVSRREEGIVKNGERLVTITGNDEQVELLQNLINEALSSRNDAHDGSTGIQENYASDVESTQIRITDMNVGLIIGHRGETIKEIRQVSGARIDIESTYQTSDLNVTGERVMTISGSAEQIQHAQDLIQAHLRESGQDLEL